MTTLKLLQSYAWSGGTQLKSQQTDLSEFETAWSTYQVLGQLHLHSETLSQEIEQQKHLRSWPWMKATLEVTGSGTRVGGIPKPGLTAAALD